MSHSFPHMVRLSIGSTLAVAVLGTASCATATRLFVTTAAEALTGEEVADVDRRPTPGDGRPGSPDAVESVYQRGATLGWQRGLRPSSSAGTSPYFTARLFAGRCPTLNIGSRDADDPFGPIDRPELKPFSLENNFGIDGDYVPFGQVALGGPGPVGYAWQPLGMYGMVGGGCDFPGLPLLSLGENAADVAVLHR